MLTYVINTSENKIFDSDRLFEDKIFELAGYNKIRWMNCHLNDIERCSKEISELQSNLSADLFRVAVLVDFYGFDKIRTPYGYNGYGAEESGVELSLYLPYIEAYISDHLSTYLNRNEVFPHDVEVYYIQNGKYDWSYFLGNGKEQLKTILVGKEGTDEETDESKFRDAVWLFKSRKEEAEAEARKKQASELRAVFDEDSAKEETTDDDAKMPICDKAHEDPHNWVTEEEYEKIKKDIKPYSVYSLYCTPDVTLDYSINEYPYGSGTAMSFDEFFNAFRDRAGRKSSIKRHHFIVSYGTTAARSAFDTLSLSLYLIKMYEREEVTPESEEFEIERILPASLIKMLEHSWNKICMAQKVARENRMEFYALENISENLAERPLDDSKEKVIGRYYTEIEKSEPKSDMPIEYHFEEIMKYAAHKKGGMDEHDTREFNQILLAYLKKRDETKEESVAEEVEEMKLTGRLRKTECYPSKSTYDFIVEGKNKEISEIMDRALKAEYVEVDFSEQKARAEEEYNKYAKAKAGMGKSIVGDVLMLAFILISMLVPYRFLQPEVFALDTIPRYLVAAGLFTVIFVFSFVLHILPLARIMKSAKIEMKRCHRWCEAKHKYSMYQLRRRYEYDLVELEEKRYELRQLAHLNEENMVINQKANEHRALLSDVENRLSGMLNNLGVEPKYNPNETIEGEFDITKDVKSPENRIYRVLSLEAIEELFSRKGDKQ